MVPDVNKSPFPRTLLLQPPGLADGDYYVEFYDEEGSVIPEPAGEPVIVSFWRRKPAVSQTPSATPSSPAPVAAAAATGASPPVAGSAPAPTPSPVPQDDWSANPDKWAHKLQVRQDHQMRDLGVAVFQQGIEQLREIRDIYATMGQEQYKNQQLALDYGKEVFELQKQLLEERKAELAQRSQVKEAADVPPAKMDYTQLGIGLLATIQAISTAALMRGGAPRPPENRSESPERTEASKRETSSGDAATQKIVLVAEEQAELALGELVKFSNPFELQKLLGDPAAQKEFADRLGKITGNAAAANVQLVRKAGRGAS